jgi:hypothetical protein
MHLEIMLVEFLCCNFALELKIMCMNISKKFKIQSSNYQMMLFKEVKA